MFSWIIILALASLTLLDLFLLVVISRGVGIPIIVVSQLITGLFGWYKIRKMDFSLFFFMDAELRKKTKIVRELWDESLILTGACLLIIPGFLTDCLGIAFFSSYLRNLCLNYFDEN